MSAISSLPQGLVDSVKDLLNYQAEVQEGKYLKYSDLLLKKQRELDKIDKETEKNPNYNGLGALKSINKEIKAEMKKLGIREETGDKEEYQKFFQAALKKFGVKSPAELEGDKEKEFYDYIDKNWKGDKESD
jgi:HD-like signal output (HDOD) protein